MEVYLSKMLSFCRLLFVFQLLVFSLQSKAVETCEAVFIASSGVAAISTSDAELLNFTTSGLLGLNVKASVADTGYSSLLSANIGLENYLDTLATEISVANKSDAVAANITLTQAIDAAITVLQGQGGNTLAIATLEEIKLTLPGDTFSLLDVIELDVADNAILSTSVNLLDFYMMSLQAFNHQNAISAQNISLDLAALGLNGAIGPLSASLSDLSVAVIAVEGPKLVSGEVGTAFSTSSIRLKINADLVDISLAPLTLLAVNVNVQLTDFEMYADVARANGTIAQLSYLSQTLRLDITPGVASLYLGQISSVDFHDRGLNSDIDYATEVSPVTIGSITLDTDFTSEILALSVRANANANGSLESVDFTGPFPKSKTTSAGLTIVNSLLSSLATNTVLSVTPAPTLIADTASLLSLVKSGVVDDVLTPVIDTIVVNAVEPVTDGLGISIGNATQNVLDIVGDSCVPTVNSVMTSSSTPVLTGLAYRSSADSELLSIEVNSVTYNEGTDFFVTDNQWSLTIPPSDSLVDGIYNVVATVSNGVESVTDQSAAELTVDSVQPSIQIQNVPANTNGAFTATFAFSETVTGFVAGDISVTNASVSDFTVVSSSNYTALITPSSDGVVTLDVNANVAQDGSGNNNTAATQASSIMSSVRPSVQIQNVPATTNSAFTATFAFSDVVTGFDASDIIVTNASVSDFTVVSGSNYTALITPSSDGVVTLDVNADVAQDSSGNNNTAATQVSTTIDSIRPSVQIQNVPANTNGAFTATFAFSETVTGFVAGDISVTNASVSDFTVVSGSNYTALITPSSDGVVTLDVNANVAQDSSGNNNTAATQVSTLVDTVRPSVQIQNVPANTNGAFTATFAFSDVVTGFDASDIIVTNASVSDFTVVSGSNYTALITPSSDGVVTLDVNADVAQDGSGNNNTAATQVSTSVDTVRPSVQIQNVPANTNGSFTATFAFSETVTGFVAGDISVTNASVSDFTVVSGSNYTALITPSSDGVVTLDVNANVAQDSSGNNNTAATQVSTSVDTVRPSVQIQNVPATTVTPFTATFAFSEAVTGFVASDISVTNATVSNLTTVSGSNYTALVTPASAGLITLDVNADVAHDISGNGNTAALQVTSNLDNVRPSVQIQNVPTNTNGAFTATFAFSETVTGFVAGDISVTNASVSDFTVVSGSNYTALITPSSDGVVTLDVNANVAQDSSGNNNTAATQVSTSVDTVRPSVQIQNVPATTVTPFTATFTFSEIVTGFVASDISVTNATVSNLITVSGSSYTALVTPTSTGLITLDVNADVAHDISGNGNTAALQVTSNLDNVRPSVQIQNVPTNTNGAFTATFAFSETVTGFVAGDISVTNASVSDFTVVSGSNYTALITPSSDGVVTLDVNADVAQDSSGNNNTAATQVSTSVDTVRPSVQIQNVPANTNIPFTATFAFSEAVTGFVASDISVTNATVSNLITVSGSNYTALVTPASAGLITLDVNADVAHDISGNGNTAALQVTSNLDNVRPSVQIQNVPTNTNGAFTATFAFSETVTGFVAGDISVTNASVSDFTVVSGSNYTALITPSSDGVVTLDVNADVAQDSSGNNNTAATQVSTSVDTVRPSVQIQNVPANTNIPFTATFTFSETVTGFVASDISVTNATVSNLITVSGSSYTALVTPTSAGVVTLDINANVSHDISGNGNTAAVQVTSNFNSDRPSVQIQNVPTYTDLAFTATFAFSETVTGFVAGDISVTNASVSDFTVVSGSKYTALITPSSDGAITLDVNADVAHDIGGNGNIAAVQVTSNLDNVRPSVQIQNVPANTNGAFTATFAFSEAVTGFVLGDISVTNASVSNFTALSSGKYAALVTPSSDGIVTLNINADVAQDSSSNNNTAATQVSSAVDSVRPSIQIQNVPTNTNGAFTATFTFSEAVTGFVTSDVSVTNATISNLVTNSGSSYTALVTPISAGGITLDVNADVAHDISSNGNTAALQVTSNLDNVRPSVQIQNVPANTNGAFTATFAFSETVTDFVAGDISVTNASVSNFTAISGSNYTALITPSGDGELSIGINANVAQDGSGNNNTASTKLTSTVDSVRPSVQIQNVPDNTNIAFTATFTFSEVVTGFVASDITATNATISNLGTNSGSSYTALVTPTAAGVITLDVIANVAHDISGNGNTAAIQVTSNLDSDRPSVQIQNVPTHTNSAFTATFAFSEEVTGFVVTDISATNASITNFTTDNTSNYSALITPSNDGELTLDINANVAQDSSGNNNIAATQVSTTMDTQAPQLTIVSNEAINLSNQSSYQIEGSCSETGSSVEVIINQQNPKLVICDEGEWLHTTNLSQMSDGDTSVTLNANQTDKAGNTGSALAVVLAKDTQEPNLTVDEVSYGSNDALIFKGTADVEEGTTVVITESSDNILCLAVISGGTWQCQSTTVLPDGSYDLRAEVEDSAENLAIVYFSQDVDLDADNDGITNAEEGDADTDNDGIPDAMDTDSDNDGIPDSIEGSADDDGDNIPNFRDSSSDEDSDGVPDIIEGNADSDNDGIINALDFDSDNDGIVDGKEANVSGNDHDQDGIDDAFDADIGGNDADGDGITYTPIDRDGDGVANYLDKDSDGDAIPDAIEAFQSYKDSDEDGIWDRYDVTQTGGLDVDNDGIDDSYDADITNGIDADNDGVNDVLMLLTDHNQNSLPDHLDVDSDSDGIYDAIEAQVTGNDHDNDGIDDTFDADLSNDIDLNNDGIIDELFFPDTDGDGTIDINDLDSDNDGNTDALEANVQDSNADGIIDLGAPMVTQALDSDFDNIPDHIDTDKNNDGIFDIQDNGIGRFDLNNDGHVDRTEDIDRDGIDDSVDGDTQVLGHGNNADSDNDSILDVIDKDDDNDGIADVKERLLNPNDNTTVNKVSEVSVSNYNATIVSSTDSNSIQNQSVTLRILDSDNDGVINERDQDSDNDGISDSIENGRPSLTGDDHDKDGIDNAFDADFTGGNDSDQDGIDDTYFVADTDQDSVPDYLDLDSDNDNISDNAEQMTVAPLGIDANANGIDDAFDPAFNLNQDDNLDGIDDTTIMLTDIDGDTRLNFQDIDSDGDGIDDIDEQATDFDNDQVPNYLDLDSDNDGISDEIEGKNDFDNDGASNFLDLDSDNDGISDQREGANDFDGDGEFNFLDLDSDNDGISDQIEGETDFDGDGVFNYLDLDSDNDGISDAEEGASDSDGDGVSNYLDLDSDNDGISDSDENGDFNGDGINDANQEQTQVQSSLKGAGNTPGVVIVMLMLLNLIRYRSTKKSFMLIWVLACFSANSTAQSSVEGHVESGNIPSWYITYSLGKSNIEPDPKGTLWQLYDNNDMAYKVAVGYHFTEQWFGEFNYIDLGQARLKPKNPNINQVLNIDYKGYSTHLGYWFKPINADLNYYAKIGVTKITPKANFPEQHKQVHIAQLAFSAGVKWRINQHWSLNAEFDSYDKDARFIGLAVRYNLAGSYF